VRHYVGAVASLRLALSRPPLLLDDTLPRLSRLARQWLTGLSRLHLPLLDLRLLRVDRPHDHDGHGERSKK
jgi:hypothetical protein